MEDKFEDFKIRTFEFWDLYLHKNQFPYLGRCYAWAKRPEARKVSDMNPAETKELFEVVLPAWEKALKIVSNPDWTNAACLGNTSPHLHWHFIPRYNSPRQFDGFEFIDPNPKGNYAPYPKKELPTGLLMHIKTELTNNIPRPRKI